MQTDQPTHSRKRTGCVTDIWLPRENRAPTDEELEVWYQQQVRPHEEQLEKRRKSTERTFWALFVGAILLGVFAIWSFFNLQDQSGIVISMGLVGGVACLMYFASSRVRFFHSEIRDLVLPAAVRGLGTEFRVMPEPIWSVSELKRFGIVPRHKEAQLTDNVKGQYKDIPVELAQAHLTASSGARRESDNTVFKGQILLARPNRLPKVNLVIVRDSGLGLIGDVVGSISKRMAKITLEDPRFERRFDVFGDDQVTARVLMTPSFMQRLMDLEDRLDLGAITVSFHNGDLLIMAYSGVRWFQPSSLFKPVDLHKDMLSFAAELEIMLRIIDTLHLDNDTGL